MPKKAPSMRSAASTATPALFRDMEPLVAQAPSSSGLCFHGRERELSKEQRAFNRLMAQIRNLQARIEQGERRQLELDRFYVGEFRPAMESLGQAAMQLALGLDGAAAKPAKNAKRLLKRIIPALLQEAFELVESTPEAMALYDKYARRSYQAQQEAESAEESQVVLDSIEAMGFDLPPEIREKIHDPDAVDQIADHLEREREAYEFSASARKSRPRKKSQRQIEREQRERQKQDLKQRSLRDIYIALAKVLHPDIETDPERKLHKEAFLKRATVAYNEGNLVELLQLEMEWMETGGLQEGGPDKLPLYLELLKDQVRDLEGTCMRIDQRFWEAYGVFGVSIEAFRRKLNGEKRDAEIETERLRRMARELEAAPERLEHCLMGLLKEL